MAVGVGTGLLVVVVPDGIGVVFALAGAVLAGFVYPRGPMVAAVLFLSPPFVVLGVRLVIDDGSVDLVGLALGLVSGVIVVAIFTHVGAGIALRRQE
jgi:hypothetical protein